MSPEQGEPALNSPSTKVNMTKWAVVDVHTKKEMMGELPRLNDGYHGKHYCYYYMFAFPADSKTQKDPYITKVNVCEKTGYHSGGGTQEGLSWGLPNQYCTEPIFVPNPKAEVEDDGVVLTVVLDGTKGDDGLGETSLVVLDAKTMKEIARVKAPVRIPYDVHGHFFPAGTDTDNNA